MAEYRLFRVDGPMNYAECRETVESALRDLQSKSAGIELRMFLARQKLQAVLDGWPPADAETLRLMRFEVDTRDVLGTPLEIRPAGWKNADGKQVWLRVLDDANVLRLLGLPPRGDP